MWKTHDRKAQTVKELRDSMLTKFKKKYIGDWDFYRRYLLLAIPMILQNAITNLVSFLDNIMVGQLGTEQMSGVAIEPADLCIQPGDLRSRIRSQHLRCPVFWQGQS